MRKYLLATVEALLLLAAAALIGALALPQRPPEIPRAPLEQALPAEPGASGEALPPPPRHPAEIAALWGWRPAKAPEPEAAAPPAPAPAPREAGWLRYVGSVKEQDGITYFYFKDTRNGRIIKAGQDPAPGGWQVMEVRAGAFLLAGEDTVYRTKGP